MLHSLKKIKYPREKLEVFFIVEQFDRRTISYLNKQKEDLFKIICVPRGGPQTKPKACNYVLNYIKGEYLVVYDAEDQPDPYQLLHAVSKFKRGDKKLVCLQGKLNFYNSSENILTSFFAIEYFCWFNIFLKGLLNLKMPIPLGGSSNHFKVDVLKKIGGWDPYNVTEDADLGYRLFKAGYKVDILESTTLEEAPFTVGRWMNQRMRWVKGHLQTYLVHLRTNGLLKINVGRRGVLGFHLFLFFPIMSYILQCLALFFIFYQQTNFKLLTLINYGLWIMLSLFFAIYTLKKCKQKILLKSIILYNFYYFLHSIASICALYKLITKPHHWEKTEHDFFKRFKGKKRFL